MTGASSTLVKVIANTLLTAFTPSEALKVSVGAVSPPSCTNLTLPSITSCRVKVLLLPPLTCRLPLEEEVTLNFKVVPVAKLSLMSSTPVVMSDESPSVAAKLLLPHTGAVLSKV